MPTRARQRKGQHEQATLDEGEGGDAFAARNEANSSTRRPFPAPGDRLEAEERRAAILNALDKIPAGQREVVLLYFYAEMTLPEIAQAVGRNLSTVKYQFYAAHVKIAEQLAGTPWAVPINSSHSSKPTENVAAPSSSASSALLGRKARLL